MCSHFKFQGARACTQCACQSGFRVFLGSFHHSRHFASMCRNHSFQGGLNFVVDISICMSCSLLGRVLRGLCASSQSGSLPSRIADLNSLHRYLCLVEKGSFIEMACHISLLIHMHVDSFPAAVTCHRAWSVLFSGSFASFPLRSSQYWWKFFRNSTSDNLSEGLVVSDNHFPWVILLLHLGPFASLQQLPFFLSGESWSGVREHVCSSIGSVW
jgi:hypothetical protein